MKRQRLNRLLTAWVVLAVFSTQILFAEVVRTDGQPKATSISITKEVVRSDGQPRISTPTVTKEVVRSDGQPRVSTPTVTKEVVRSDGQPRVTTPVVSKEVVRSDGQPRTSTPAIAGEVVRSDGQPMTSGKGPAVNPFVGEIAVGVSLLVAYGPQIIALAATVATLAAAVHTITGAGKSSFDIVKGIGAKLKNLLQLLLGPLGISTGMTKQGVEDVSTHLLNVTKFVSNSISTPVDQIQGKIDTSLAMSRDVEALSLRGKAMADHMKSIADQTGLDLKNITAGGEIQLFRDGASKVSDRLGRQAGSIGGAFDQTIVNSRTTTSQLEGVKAQIETALSQSGKPAGEVTLHDLQLSGADLSKKLIEARKYMVQSDKVLIAADQSNSGLHTEVLGLLNSIKGDLETYAKMNGIDPDKLARMTQDPGLRKNLESGPMPVLAADKAGNKQYKLTDEISFMVDKLDRMQQTTKAGTTAMGPAAEKGEALKPVTSGESKTTTTLHQQKVQAFKAYMDTLARDPGNAKALETAQKSFETAEQQYRQSLQKDSAR